MHSAILSDDLRRVQALINLGLKSSDTKTISYEANTIWNVSALNMAIYQQNPEIFTSLLLSSEGVTSLNIKCCDENGILWTSISLALHIFNQTKNDETKLVNLNIILE